MTIEERAIAEERAFADYLRGVVSEERAAGDVNMAKADGAATIPTTIANKIITKVWDICPIAARATRYNAKGTLSIPYYPATVSGATPDLAMAYAAEFSELESTSGKFTSIDLQAFLAGVLTKVSKSLVNNSQFDIVGFVVLPALLSKFSPEPWVRAEPCLAINYYGHDLTFASTISVDSISILNPSLQVFGKSAFQCLLRLAPHKFILNGLAGGTRTRNGCPSA